MEVRMATPQFIHDPVNSLDVLLPDLATDDRSRLGGVAVHIPLEKINGVVPEQGIEGIEDMGHDLRPSKIQHELIAAFRAGTPGKMQDPIGMGTIEVGVGVDHLRFHPQAKGHAKAPDLVNDGFQTTGQALRAHRPVPEAGPVIPPGTEPPIINALQLHPDFRSPAREGDLLLLIDIKIADLPAIIEHRAMTRMVRRAGQYVILRPPVQLLAGPAPTVGR